MAGDVPITSGTTNFDKTLQTLIETRLEEQLRSPLVHLMPGNFRPAKFVKGSNNTLRYLAIGDIQQDVDDLVTPVAGTAPWLEEGVTPDAGDIDITYEEFSANQAGRLIKMTDVAMMESPWDLVNEASTLVARDAITVADQRVARVLAAGTHVMYASADHASRITLDNTDLLTGAYVQNAVALLSGSNVPRFPDGTYHGIIHSYAAADLKNDTADGGWIDANRYANARALLTGELGEVFGVRFSDSAGAAVFKGAGSGSPAIDVYSTIIFGPEAYAYGDWDTIRVHITPPGGQGDPLHQRAYVGWKSFFGARILTLSGAPKYIRIESGTGVKPAAA